MLTIKAFGNFIFWHKIRIKFKQSVYYNMHYLDRLKVKTKLPSACILSHLKRYAKGIDITQHASWHALATA